MVIKRRKALRPVRKKLLYFKTGQGLQLAGSLSLAGKGLRLAGRGKGSGLRLAGRGRKNKRKNKTKK